MGNQGIIDRITNLFMEAGVALKAGGVAIAILAFLFIIKWGANATLGRLVIGLVVAGGIITVVAKPDLLMSDIENTFAAPAVVQYNVGTVWSGGGGLDLPARAAVGGGAL